jgi:hypothetical protein
MTDWERYNMLARSYLDFQHLRIAIEDRIRRLYESQLIKAGIMEEIIKIKQKPNGKPRREITRRLLTEDSNLKEYKAALKELEDAGTTSGPDYEDAKQNVQAAEEIEAENKIVRNQAKQIEKDLQENDYAYSKMYIRAQALRKDEKRMLDECREMFESTEVWTWCESTRGLGEVAAMTLLGYIRPTYVDPETGQEKPRRVRQVWKYFGLTENSKIVAGEQAHYNLEVKGRILGVIAGNLIMQGDSYYSAIYRIKKEYYNHIDEILERKDTEKGWKAHIDNMAKVVMMKIVVSHAVQIILESLGLPFASEHGNHMYIPPKSDDEAENMRIIQRFKDSMPEQIRIRNKRYKEEKKDAVKEGITVKELRKKRKEQWKTTKDSKR